MASRIGFRTTSLSGVVAVACALALVLAAPGDAARRAQRVVPVAPSLADRFAVDSPAMAVALAIAERHWGRPACGGSIALSRMTAEPRVNARTTWQNPLSLYDHADLNFDCRIAFNARARLTWPAFCTVVVHEVGHLVGHPHAADGRDVMSPVLRVPLGACAATPEPRVRP